MSDPPSTSINMVKWHDGGARAGDSLLSNDDDEANNDYNNSEEGSDDIVCRVPRYKWVPPPEAASITYKPHAGEGSQYLRDFILGVNDGLVSVFLLIVAVVAGGASTTTTLLSGISAGIAGAISMGLGEYVATKSQTTVNIGEMNIEKEHFRYFRDIELAQLRTFLTSVNLSGNLLEAVVAEVGRNDDSLMKMMMAFEFGAGSEEQERNPIIAMLMSARLFILGCVPSIFPFFFVKNPFTGLWIAFGTVGLSLFIVGAYKTRTTRGNPWFEGFENLALGAVGAGLSYLVGYLFQLATGNDQTSA